MNDDPQETLITMNASILAQMKVAALVAESRRKRIDRAKMKFDKTHEFIFGFQPRSHTGKFEQNEDKSFKLNEDGTRIPLTRLDTTWVQDEKKDWVEVPVHVNVYRFTGWDYGKKWNGEQIRALRKKETDAAIGDQTEWADGTPIVRGGAAHV